MPASDLLFVGKKTADVLLSLGIRTIGELARASEQMLAMRFGKMGEMLHKYANGLDDSPVAASETDPKSISNGFTFRHNLVGRDECRVGIEYLSEEIGRRLRINGQKCSTVSLSIKDEFLRTIQRQCPQNPPTDIAKEIAATAYELLLREWSENKPIRMLTVSAANLVRSDMVAEQISFFGEKEDKKRKINSKRENAIDKIRQKYGADSIVNGAILDSDIGIYSPKDKKSK